MRDCENEECIENLADQYIEFIRRGGEDQRWNDEGNTELDFDKSYTFIDALLRRLIDTEIEPRVLLMILERDLGETHPVVLLLREELEEEY